MQRFLHFLTYNNAVPIAISLVLLGAGGAFAATDPQAIYSAQQQVVSVDNSYIVNKDLTAYMPRIEILGVTEDEENYFVAYRLYTIDIKDSVWQDVTKSQTMTVSKTDLGPNRDLGVYVTEQLSQVTDRELGYLQEVQGIERKNVTSKVVATQYGGLVGKFLDPTTETLPGYTPVVTAPAPGVQLAGADASNMSAPAGSSDTSSGAPAGNSTMRIQLLGNNPAQIPRGAAYSDLGVVASDAQNDNLRIETYLDGTKTDQLNIDTRATSTHTVRYVAFDPSSNSIAIERTVIVYDPNTGQPVPDSQVQHGQSAGAALPQNVPSVTPAPTPTPTPTPAPAPTPTPAPSDTASTTPDTQTPAPDTASSTPSNTQAPAPTDSTASTTTPTSDTSAQESTSTATTTP